MKRTGWLVGIASVLMLSSVASAQINGPVPAPFSHHVWSVPGVINNGSFGAFIACTNAGSSTATVGVEVFGAAGGVALNNAGATAISTASGATVLFGTSTAVSFSVDANLAPGPVAKGSARVLSTTSKGILCSAFLADPAGQPPVAMTNLTIVKRTSQRGQ
jgi:hypothetical protein